MNFDAFLTALHTIQNSIAITSPLVLQNRRSYFGAPAEAITDLPCVINTFAETERSVGLGGARRETYRITVQMLIARITVEDTRSSRIAGAFWFAMKDAFDANTTINGTVLYAVIHGANPTVPVILQHGGQAFIGIDAYLEITQVRT